MGIRPAVRAALALTVLLAAIAAVALSAGRQPANSAAEAAAPIVSIERGRLRFEYNSITGSSYLWDLRVPEAERLNRIRDLPDDAARMRLELERSLNVRSLDILHEPHRVTAEHLRELGYL